MVMLRTELGGGPCHLMLDKWLERVNWIPVAIPSRWRARGDYVRRARAGFQDEQILDGDKGKQTEPNYGIVS